MVADYDKRCARWVLLRGTRQMVGFHAIAIALGGSISTLVCSRTLSASRTFTARSSVIPKYSFRSSRDTWDSCTESRFASSRCEIPFAIRSEMSR